MEGGRWEDQGGGLGDGFKQTEELESDCRGDGGIENGTIVSGLVAGAMWAMATHLSLNCFRDTPPSPKTHRKLRTIQKAELAGPTVLTNLGLGGGSTELLRDPEGLEPPEAPATPKSGARRQGCPWDVWVTSVR